MAQPIREHPTTGLDKRGDRPGHPGRSRVCADREVRPLGLPASRRSTRRRCAAIPDAPRTRRDL